jgi:guanylate kinase
LCLVLCAPSGTGKTPLARRLRREFSQLTFSLSATTRPPRPGERDGEDYLFLTQETFIARRDAHEFAEWAEVHGNLYGTPLQETRSRLAQGNDMLFDIDVQGAAKLRPHLPHGVFGFCFPPSMRELEARLRRRGADDEASIRRRLDDARREIAQADLFDAWIINDDLETAYGKLRSVYLAATLAPGLRPNLPADILKG